MHRSRLSTLLVDVPLDEVPRATAFWASALGVATHQPPGEPQFTVLEDAVPNLVTAVQSVDDPPRYHVDIETDDVAAEVGRLVALGAVEVSSWQGCHTLRVPGGHLLCVIPVHSDPDEFAAHARVWS
ncbi:VOC family protein [Jiangella asiatica]|uniref:Glyoxalase/bleomycin resistance/dioxygenase family protein n=1 Tax=Jiangella asiatica TaxID=2530372 RepID=A0A4R5CBE1_9ACTN|nr:VOC family protein [Jiangella asiatica]TDD97271.1 glyoxalase/bleomycin resistance/dioxygenase family protein [Jiangella asiatica]